MSALLDRRGVIALLFLLFGACAAVRSHAYEIAGVSIDDTSRLADKQLKLNGAGIRYKVFIKLYVAALYASEKMKSTAEVLSHDDEKRISLVMLRDISSESFSHAFIDGLKRNTSVDEQIKIMKQILAVGDVFAMIPELKKGDTVTIDWVPKLGTVLQLNGKPIHEAIQDVAFYHALLKIWLGDHPPDENLKRALLNQEIVVAQRNTP